MIREHLLTADYWLGSRVSLRQKAYDAEFPCTTADEWSAARKSGYRGVGPDAGELSTDTRYLRRMFTRHVRNTFAALRFARTFDLSHTRGVLEVGCGEMVQAWVLKTVYPHLRYVATDFDPFVIERCAALATLRDVE